LGRYYQELHRRLPVIQPQVQQVAERFDDDHGYEEQGSRDVQGPSTDAGFHFLVDDVGGQAHPGKVTDDEEPRDRPAERGECHRVVFRVHDLAENVVDRLIEGGHQRSRTARYRQKVAILHGQR